MGLSGSDHYGSGANISIQLQVESDERVGHSQVFEVFRKVIAELDHSHTISIDSDKTGLMGFASLVYLGLKEEISALPKIQLKVSTKTESRTLAAS